MPPRRGRPPNRRVTLEEAEALSPRKTRKRGAGAKEVEGEDEEEDEEEAQGSPVKKTRREEKEAPKVNAKPKMGPKSKIDPKLNRARTEAVMGSAGSTSSSRASSAGQDDKDKFTRGPYAQAIFDLNDYLVGAYKKGYTQVRSSRVEHKCQWIVG